MGGAAAEPGARTSPDTLARSELPAVRFYFGGASRYSYLAATQIAALTAATGAAFDWVPLDVPMVLNLRGQSPFEGPSRSGQYSRAWRQQDAERWAAFYGVPFFEPSGRVEVDHALMARACTAAMGAAESFGRALLTEVFAMPSQRIDASTCCDIARECGLSREVFAVQLESESTHLQVEALAREAHALGIFGVPSFVVDGELFWGNDRLTLLRQHLLDRVKR
ncbi:MAG: DsbA family protein [Pseudomonadota bacterium]